MAKGFDGELLHFGVTRLRVTGSGNLQLFLSSLDAINVTQLTSIPMTLTTNREPTVLSNVIEQRTYLTVKTTNINEVFNISKITIFIRPVSTGYPQ